MADGDRPIVLVPLATARKAARRAGVTLDLSAEDIALAGKWKHGWIPLDAVASAVKAKRYHGGGGEGRTVKGKGRAGSAVESRREPSRGRTKSAAVGARGRMTAHESVLAERNSFGKHRGSYDLGVSDAHHFQARHDLVKEKLGPDAHRAYSAGHARVGAVDSSRSEAPRRESRAATASASLADHARAHSDASLRDLTSRFSKGTAEGRAVRAEIARRAKRDGATGRAQQVAQDRTRRVEAARGEPKLADLSEADLQSLISRYGEKSVQADAARAEMLRRSRTVGGHRVVANPARGRSDTSADRAGAEAAKHAETARRTAEVRAGGGDHDPAYAKYPVPSLKRMAESQSGPASVKAAAELRARGYVRGGNALNGKWTKGGK